MKPILRFFFVMTVCLQVNCQVSDSKSNDTLHCKILKINYNGDPDSENRYEYNENGLLIREYRYQDTIIYTYQDSKITKVFFNQNINWIIKVESTLNDAGQTGQTKTYDADGQVISVFDLEFNSKGYLDNLKQVSMSNGNTYLSKFGYEGGNLSEIKMYNAAQEMYQKIRFEYFTELRNTFNQYVGHIFSDILFFSHSGQSNMNMIKSITSISAEGDTLSHLSYTYKPMDVLGQMEVTETDLLNEFQNTIFYQFDKNCE